VEAVRPVSAKELDVLEATCAKLEQFAPWHRSIK
jgi:hypothetical protein